jgi:hypothetical protein
VIEGGTPEPSPAKGPHDGGRGTYPSPTPNIIDSLMGEVVFETFTPRCSALRMLIQCDQHIREPSGAA